MALAVASCSFSAKANGYDWKWTVRERFKVLLSNETVAFLLGMVWRSSWRHCFRTELLSSPLIEEASARSYNKYIIALFRLGSTGEYSVLGFCIGPPYGRANTASLEPNILLYCPPTRAIIYMFPPLIYTSWRHLHKLQQMNIVLCSTPCLHKLALSIQVATNEYYTVLCSTPHLHKLASSAQLYCVPPLICTSSTMSFAQVA